MLSDDHMKKWTLTCLPCGAAKQTQITVASVEDLMAGLNELVVRGQGCAILQMYEKNEDLLVGVEGTHAFAALEIRSDPKYRLRTIWATTSSPETDEEFIEFNMANECTEVKRGRCIAIERMLSIACDYFTDGKHPE
jgi:hypothetical protein